MPTRLILFPVMAFCLVLVACTTAPPTPAAEQYFADAKKNLPNRDYESALRNLDRATKAAGDQPVGQQVVLLRTALLTAMAEGAKQMADAYGSGSKEPPGEARSGQFRKMRADYHGIARVRLMNAMEAILAQRKKLGAEPVPLEMRFPDFSGTDHAALTKIKSGYWAEEADRYRAELESVRNALARNVARMTGAGDDVHKGQAAFEKGGLQVDPRIYLIEMSNTFLRLGEIFDRRALDDPRYLRICYEVVRDNMDVVLKLLQIKPDKELETKAKKIKADCEKALKAMI